MRWIDKQKIEECITQEWKNKAHNVLIKLEKLDTQARKELLRSSEASQVWKDFYNLLPSRFKEKCWYCESRQIRSDNPVDHFRPKGSVDEDKSHPGYWWLAFSWDNYRCSCTYCNSRRNSDETSGGKQDHFPLFNPSSRITEPNGNIDDEEPAILDPFNCDDHKLLWFDSDGIPILNPSRLSQKNQQKIDNTISIFHLHEARLSRKRKQILIEINKKVKKLKDAKQANNQVEILNIKTELSRMIDRDEEYSKTAEVYLKQNKNIPEIKDILYPE